MNGKGGCCVMSKVDRIMLKYRPIAPKPVAVGAGSGGSSADNKDGYVKCVRSKRKYVRVKKKENDNFKKRGREKVEGASVSSPLTLPLLSETPDWKENKSGFCLDLVSPKVVTTPRVPKVLPVVVSYVTVECVTDTWVDREALGCTDEEIVMNMEKDTCPGFISDGEDKVVWMNTSYRHMAGVVGEDDLAVVLVRKDKLTRSPVTYPAFTCKVRVTFAAQSHRETSPSSPKLTLPCDVWRMKVGTCAWRLDVKAALSLGR